MADREHSEDCSERSRTVRKPFKVAGKNRKFKGIVAGSLEELKEKSSRSLNLRFTQDEIHLYLEEDGTEIDDNEYFDFLPENTRMLILKEEEFEYSFIVGGRLHPSDRTGLERSESQVVLGDLDSTDAGNQLPKSVIETLKTNPTFFVNLSEEELSTVADLTIDELEHALGSGQSECRIIQQACFRELERRSGLREATDLLNMYQRAKEADSKELSRKKPRDSHTSH